MSAPFGSALINSRADRLSDRWYIATFGANFVGASILLTFYPQLQLPVWGLVLAVILAVVFLVPIGVRLLRLSQSDSDES